MKNVLIVCMGNICRSPMAEGLLRQVLLVKHSLVEISSAGITALIDQPPSAFARKVMLEKSGIDIGAHRARQLTQEILSKSDLVLVMDSAQQQLIEFKFPTICGRVHRLGKWSGFDISDPYRLSEKVFEQTFALIEQSIRDWQSRLWK